MQLLFLGEIAAEDLSVETADLKRQWKYYEVLFIVLCVFV